MSLGSLYLLSLASLSWSLVPSAGILPTQTIFILLVFYAFFRYCLPKLPEEFFSKLFLTLSIIILTIGYYQLLQLGLTEGLGGKAIYKVSGLSAHKNILASYTVLLFGLNLWYLPVQKGRWVYLLLALQVLLILILRARTSMIALMILIILFFFENRKKWAFHWKPVIISLSIFAAAITISFYLLVNKLGGTGVDISRLNPMNFKKDLSFIERLVIWYKTSFLIKEHWIGGIGAGNWKIFFPSQSYSGIYILQSRDIMYTRVHNDFIEILAELGIAGILIFLAIFIIPLIALIHPRFRPSDKPFPWLPIGMIFCFGLFSMIEFPKERQELMVLWAFILALIVFQRAKFFSAKNFSWCISKRKVKWGIFIASILCSLNIFIGIIMARGEFHTLKMLQAQKNGQWPIVEYESQKAYSAFYQITPIAIAVKWYEGLAAYHEGNFEKAKVLFQLAMKHTPYFLRLLNDYASCLVQTGDLEGAVDLYLQVMDINPKFEDGMFNLSYVYAQLGRFDKALEWVEMTKNDEQKKNEFIQQIHSLMQKDSILPSN
ncbi:MAG: O-antigen ligase family protein [Saprospiraceae bacterium]|nr:O-antigen ligase family protein [Saprospiraceae bacterium]